MGSPASELKETVSSPETADERAAADGAPPRPHPGHAGRAQRLQILSTFIVFMNTWGFLLTSGAFQAYYELTLIRDQSSSNISWISTTCAFLVLSAGLVTGPLYDRGWYRTLLLFGSLLQVFGLMMLSISTKYYELFLCQAICVGLGAGIVFTPSVSAAAACLPNPATRAKAMGLMACGSCIGGIVFPIMFRALVPQIGFPWTIRCIGFLVLALYLLSYLVLLEGWNKKPAARMVRRFFDTSALTDLPFMMLSVGGLLSATAFYLPLLYLPLFTKVRIANISPGLALDLLAILNGASVVGRLLAGLAAAVFGPTETIGVSLVAGSTMLFCWMAVDTVAGTIVWAVFWGMVSGILVTLPGALLPLFCPSMAVIGTRSGMYWSWVGLGMLIGSPIGGAIYDLRSAGADYWHLQVFAGVFMMGAALLTVYPILYLRRKTRASSE
ncbi:major facilitator superfamily protein [Hirsutella rhossiliensis]|uniref:Major facilitator superfamily domain-containing protein n=1 Tax=Hirsutella rhossiliensis TaxID=111463 RepID=A0A9P8SKJ7_9HYPO|nr:major facilitator superfamily domain-containing protein [Hirsutella rhossiliensis]KAH0964206.1 major facilitator superfamily domain-containing protein [Hirsutella rhossiliensis]